MKTRTKLMTVFVAVILSMTAALCLIGCNGGNALNISKTELTVAVGGSATLTASLDGSDEKAEWSIDNDEIAKLLTIGKLCSVKALKEGTATITARIGDYTATCALTVVPDNTETVKIFDGETEVSEISVEYGAGKALTAVASQGSALTWSSSNNYVATVENGQITSVRPGTCVITAQVTPSVKADVKVNVVPTDGMDYYAFTYADAAGNKVGDVEGSENAENDKFYYWSSKFAWGFQEIVVDYADYIDGVAAFKYTCDYDKGVYYGFQLNYKNSKHQVNKYYKLTAKINAEDEYLVTLNGTVLTLAKGDNDVTVFYKYTGETSSFNLVMGTNDGSNNGNGTTVQNACVAITDIAWEEFTPVALATPSFEIVDGTGDNEGKKVLDITDTNPDGAVKEYRMNFYGSDNVKQRVAVVENGAAFDPTYLENGTYTAKLVAYPADMRYTVSAETDGVEIAANNENGAVYEMQNNGVRPATEFIGQWSYWSSDWVTWETKSYANGVLTAGFGNNKGNWYDTQLFYKNPYDEDGKIYRAALKITAPKTGRVTINGDVVTLEEGMHDYDVVYRADGGQSIQILFGVNGENSKQEITDGPVTIKIESCEQVTPGVLAAPTFTVEDGTGDNDGKKIVNITDPNGDGTGSYTLGFFAEGMDKPRYTVAVENGGAIDTSKVINGKYVLRVRANPKNLMFVQSEWSGGLNFTVDNPGGVRYDLDTVFAAGDAIENPGIWGIWAAQAAWWIEGGVAATINSATYDNGTITVDFKLKGGDKDCTYGLQVNYVNPEYTQGTSYAFDIVSTADIKINVEAGGWKTQQLTADETRHFVGGGDNSFYLQVNVAANEEINAVITITNVEWGNFQPDPVEPDPVEPDNPDVPDGATAIEYTSMQDAASHKDEWRYCNTNGAGAKTATVEACYIQDGEIHIKHTAISADWTSMQLFYHMSAGKQKCDLTFKLHSSVAGKITINAGGYKVVDIIAGDNEISVEFEGAMLGIVFGVLDQAPLSGEFVISDIAYNQITAVKLAAPSFEYDADTGVITISDPNENGPKKYKANFYDSENKLVKSANVENGAALLTSGLEVGTYTVKLVAISGGSERFTDSDESEDVATVTVETKSNKEPVQTGTNADLDANLDKWLLWVLGDTTTTEKCEYDTEEKTITLKFSYKNENVTPFDVVRLIYRQNPPTQKKYLRMQVTVEHDCYITSIVGGNKEITLTAENNGTDIYLPCVGPDVWFAMGGVSNPTASNIADQTIIIKIVEFTDTVPTTKLAAPSFEYDEETGVITLTDTNENGPKKYKANYYKGETLVTSLDVVSGEALPTNGLDVGEYTVKFVAVANGVLGLADSDESEETLTLNVETKNTKTPLTSVNNDGEDLNNNRDKWVIWAQHVDVSESTYDTETGTITVSYTYQNPNDKPWYSVRILYRQTAPPKRYIKFTINVEQAGVYTINNKTYNLEAGDNELYVETLGTDVFIVLGEMNVNPGRDAQTVTISNIEFTDTAPPSDE